MNLAEKEGHVNSCHFQSDTVTADQQDQREAAACESSSECILQNLTSDISLVPLQANWLYALKAL